MFLAFTSNDFQERRAGVKLALFGLAAIFHAIAAYASPLEDGIKLYEDGQFIKAVHAFRESRQATMSDSRAAYYYALSLNSAGRNSEAVKVCQEIIVKFPSSEAAKMAQIAIKKWSDFHAVANASAKLRAEEHSKNAKRSLKNQDLDQVGILGFKFEVNALRKPLIKQVFADTPAAEFLKVDDEIMAINNVSTHLLTKEQVYNLIVGKPNTAVQFAVVREGKLLTFSMKRLSACVFSELHPDIWKEYLRQ